MKRSTKLGLLALLHAAVSLAVFVLTEARTRIETEISKLKAIEYTGA